MYIYFLSKLIFFPFILTPCQKTGSISFIYSFNFLYVLQLHFCLRRSVVDHYVTRSLSMTARAARRIGERRSVRTVQISIKRRCQKKAERDHSRWQQLSRCHPRRADEECEMYQLIFPWSL